MSDDMFVMKQSLEIVVWKYEYLIQHSTMKVNIKSTLGIFMTFNNNNDVGFFYC